MLSGQRAGLMLLTASILAAAACASPENPSPISRSTANSSGSISGNLTTPHFAALPEDPANWTMAARNYASTRFSQLDEIDTSNVARLKVAWTFSTGMLAGHEAAPLVIGSTMFLITPFPNVVFALDLSRQGAPIKWKYEPVPLGAAKGVACCDVVNWGVAFLER